jgi:[ribosomal protein S5]-alanine N-acetyltransferase
VRRAPLEIETERLLMRRPSAADAPAIFERYAADPEVTRYMAWPAHQTLKDTYAFLTFCDSEWARWPAGPYLIHARADGRLLGSTGYAFESRDRAITGYIFARDAWGQGFATESLRAIVALAPRLGIRRLSAAVHAEHTPSARVLEKCGFAQEARLPRFMVFPNLGSSSPADVLSYALELNGAS